jgi:UDP-glucose 4-epimerase
MIPKIVMVTGGTGVNGVWVVRKLIEKNVRPVVLDSRPDMTFLHDVARDFDFITGDVRDLTAVLRLIRDFRPEAIVHLAAMMPDAAQADPKLGFEVNAMATVNLLEAARMTDISKFVYTSSKAAYGPVEGEHGHPTYLPLDEDYPARPFGVYDVTKLASEGMGLNYARQYGIDFIALRYAQIFGPGKLARHGILSIHGRIIENAMLGKPTRIPQGADQRDDVIYVKDVANSIWDALAVEHPRSRIFHIGSGETHTLVELAAILKKRFPASEIEIGPGLDYLNLGRQLYSLHDLSRASRELGYKPAFTFERGIHDYIDTMQHFGVAPIHTP